MNKIPGPILGRLDAMLRQGASGPLSDGQLLDRVDEARGDSAEAAFAALVERHGPMVLRVCRDSIGDPHDAEDAFQAVFLVLARKARSIRRRESAAGWLFGVARVVSARARKDAARRRKLLNDLASLPPARSPRAESWEELHEELARLPEAYRSAVVLCHLEGLSHEEAAHRLGCPLRTLQSRLLRARARLRENLARRGVTPGAGALALLERGATAPPIAAKLAGLTARVALNGSTGTIPAAVSSLADGVLTMSTATKLILSTAALAAIGLASGLAWAVAPNPPAPPAPPIAAVEAKEPAEAAKALPEAPGPVVARGVVVDEAGRPVPGAEVLFAAFNDREARGVSGPDGSFAVTIRNDRLEGRSLLARSADGQRLALFLYQFTLTPEQAGAPVRMTLRPGRAVSARVVDAGKSPVEGAKVVAIGGFQVLAEGATGPDGLARLTLPDGPDVKVEWLIALKSGRGLDYAEFGKIDERGNSQGGVKPSEVPATVALTLDGARTAKIRAVDEEGNPLAGVRFGPWLIQKEGRRGQLNLGAYRAFGASTGADGVATFDYLPPTKRLLQFWPQAEGFALRRVIVEEDATDPVTTTLTRTETIRGRVTFPDGSPAPGIMIRAIGTGVGQSSIDQGQGSARTAADGSYEIVANPGEGYAVSVVADDGSAPGADDWTAPARLDVHVRRGEPAVGVDLRLTRGTLIRGTVTVGPGDRPGADQGILLDQVGGQGPVERWENGEMHSKQIRRELMASTDAQGRYAIRVGPGTYTLHGPPRTTSQTLVVGDEPEIIRDFRMPRPEKGPIAGRVVAGADGRGVAGAKVEIFAVHPHSIPFKTTADAEGRFVATRDLDPLLIRAGTADGSLGAIVEVGTEQAEVVIALAPTASATGLLVDDRGDPVPNQKLDWGRRVFLDAKRQLSTEVFGPVVKTDGNGQFTLPALVVGQSYEISVVRNDGVYLPTGLARPEVPGAIDLGPLRVGAYKPEPALRPVP